MPFDPSNYDWADKYIDPAAVEFQISQALIKGLIMRESSFRIDAYREEPSVNDASYGLMQLLYGTAEWMGYQGEPEGLFDPKSNVYYGCKFYRWIIDYLQKEFPEADVTDLAIAGYNTGPGRVRRLAKQHGPDFSKIQPYLHPITRRFVPDVRKYEAIFRKYHIEQGR